MCISVVVHQINVFKRICVEIGLYPSCCSEFRGFSLWYVKNHRVVQWVLSGSVKTKSLSVLSKVKVFRINHNHNIRKLEMALIGNIEPFSGVADEFEVYLDRIEHLFAVNVVEDRMKVSMFITLAGSKVYQTLKNLAAPRRPSDLLYEELTVLLSRHYSPPVSEIYERFIFNCCNQKPEQNVADYIVELRKLASSCNFGMFLEQALRDRFVCGLKSESIQRKLLANSILTFEGACRDAQAAELAEKQVKKLSLITEQGDNELHQVKQQKKLFQERQWKGKPTNVQGLARGSGGSCGKCGRVHVKGHCPAQGWRCFNCTKVGHVKSCCPFKIDIVEEVNVASGGSGLQVGGSVAQLQSE